jgi:hypothetical protein
MVGAAKNSASEIGVVWISAENSMGAEEPFVEPLHPVATIANTPARRTALVRNVRIALHIVEVLQEY